MKQFSFTLILAGFSELTETIENAFFEGGCDDGALGMRARVPFISFTREAKDFKAAVEGAIRNVNRMGYDVVRVEPDELVSAAEIAARSGRTRENIRQFINAERGPGSFPPPIAGLTSHSPLWSWPDVAQWLCKHKAVDHEVVCQANTIHAINQRLKANGNFTTETRRRGERKIGC